MPGYRPLVLYPHDMAKAKQLIAEAAPADREITVWAVRGDPEQAAAAYYRRVLQELGFEAHLKLLGTYRYFEAIGRSTAPDLDTGWGNWFAAYPHPQDFFRLLDLPIRSHWNKNCAQFEAPALEEEVRALGHEPGPVPEERYAALDRAFMEQAPWAPFGTLDEALFVSKRVDLNSVVWNPTFGADLTSFRFK